MPFNNPKYAISVVIEHGGGASLTAAPVAKEISVLLKQRDSIYTNEYNNLGNILSKQSNK